MIKLNELFTPEQFAEMYCRREEIVVGHDEWTMYGQALCKAITEGRAAFLTADEFAIILTTCEFIDHLIRENTKGAPQ